MQTPVLIFGIYLFLAIFNAGNMVTLQFQHYGIYRFVGETNFKDYMNANNKSALIPSILPAMLLLVCSIILLFLRPTFMSQTEAIIVLALNLIAFFSTFRWQRRLQSEMASEGYDAKKINTLVSTNRLRTSAIFVQALMAVYIAVINLNH